MSSGDCIQGLEKAARWEKLFPSPPHRRRVSRCPPGFSWHSSALGAWEAPWGQPGPTRGRGCGAEPRHCSATDVFVSCSPSRLGPRVIVEYCHLPNCAKWPPPIINNSWSVAPRHVTKAGKLMNETPTRENLGSCLLSHYPRGPTINLPSF